MRSLRHRMLLSLLVLGLCISISQAQQIVQTVPLAGGGLLVNTRVAAVTNGTTTAATFTNANGFREMDIVLNITSGGTDSGSLQVFLEDSTDNGVTWDDVVASKPFTFGSAATTQAFQVNLSLPFIRKAGAALQQETLTAGTVRSGPWGSQLRVREVVSNIQGTPTGPTYSVSVLLKQ